MSMADGAAGQVSGTGTVNMKIHSRLGKDESLLPSLEGAALSRNQEIPVVILILSYGGWQLYGQLSICSDCGQRMPSKHNKMQN
ncbi:hypothetical protein [Herbaspirillum rubrisubalbicans]|uniref:hypothetical protein n=2 Tax=Herbaspirillum rubrisubalbicans TaxID=80842 RepID=UPI0012FD5D14|nr:hypothetical protein [Herbaspirillum rubrisubalbicans]